MTLPRPRWVDNAGHPHGPRRGTLPSVLAWLGRIPERIGRPATGIDYIPQIDGLRFLSILFVMLWHASLRASRHAERLSALGPHIAGFYAFVPHGEIGVDCFIFISSYVITQFFQARQGQSLSISGFYFRRARRIYPPYLLVLVLAFGILDLAGYRPTDAPSAELSTVPLTSSLLASLVFLHGLLFGTTSRLDPPMWSLEIEVHFYILAPILWIMLVSLGSRRNRLMALVASLLVLTILPGILMFYIPIDQRFRTGLLTHLYLFIAGALATEFKVRSAPSDARQSPGHDLLLPAGLVILIGIGVVLTGMDATPASGVAVIFLNIGVLLGIAAIFLGAMRGRFSRIVLGNRWLCLIGTMCYSIYLTHILVMQAVAEKLLAHFTFRNPVLIWSVWFAVLLPLSVAVGAVFYVLVERPCMTRRKPATPRTQIVSEPD